MTTTKKIQSRAARMAADQSMIDGTTKNEAKLPASFPLGSQTVTPAAMIITTYQNRINTAKAALAAEAAKAAAVKADLEMQQETSGQCLAYKQLVTAMFKESPDVLGDFALKAPNPTPPTAATKAAAAAKRKATRTADHPVAPAAAAAEPVVAAAPAAVVTKPAG